MSNTLNTAKSVIQLITLRIFFNLNAKPWILVHFYAENGDIYTEYLNTKSMHKKWGETALLDHPVEKMGIN